MRLADISRIRAAYSCGATGLTTALNAGFEQESALQALKPIMLDCFASIGTMMREQQVWRLFICQNLSWSCISMSGKDHSNAPTVPKPPLPSTKSLPSARVHILRRAGGISESNSRLLLSLSSQSDERPLSVQKDFPSLLLAAPDL